MKIIFINVILLISRIKKKNIHEKIIIYLFINNGY
jgi:hypothetical protein